MAPAENTFLPAIREAVARARALASSGPCEACGASETTPFAFAYGRIVKKDTTHEGSATVYTTYYNPIDARVVQLCRRCVERQKVMMLRRIRNQTIVVGSLMIFVLPMIAFYGTQELYVLPVVALIGLGLTFLLSQRPRRKEIEKDIRVAGQAKALDLFEEELRRQGFDVFWSGPGYTL